MRHPVGCVKIKNHVGGRQNTNKYLFATAGVQDGNNYMLRPFSVAIIRLYILETLETRNIQLADGHWKEPKHVVVAILYTSSSK